MVDRARSPFSNTSITVYCSRFPKYEVIGDADAMRTAALNKRYTDASLKGIIADIHFLSRSDFIVCTFSSQVSRLPTTWTVPSCFFPICVQGNHFSNKLKI